MSVLTPGRDMTETDEAVVGVPRDCIHCGLPTMLSADDQGRVFCCNGCRGAYELIHDWGLQSYYDLRDGIGDQRPDSTPDDSFDDLDDPALMGVSAPRVLQTESGRSLFQCKLSVTGLHCAACVWLLEQSPRRVDGWQSSKVNYHERTLEVVFDPSVTTLSTIGRIANRLGYRLLPMNPDEANEAMDAANRGMLIDIAVAGFCAANAMWVAVALYAGQFTGMAPTHMFVLRIAGVILGVVAVLVPGRVFFRSALSSLWARTPHMDLPVAVGLAAGVLASLYGLWDVSREVYFDSIAALVFFLLTGRWIQLRQQRRAGDEVAELIRLTPKAADRRDASGQWERVPVENLKLGDHIRVRTSQGMPVDGIIESGQTLVDRSLLTGESRPVRVGPGDSVEAGTDNVQAEIEIRATAVGDQTRLASLRDAVAGAAAARTPVVQLANRIGGWFVVIVLVLAFATVAFWWSIDANDAVSHGVSLLIVACPCALALATPLAVAVTVGRLASRRVLVRSGDALERFSRPGTVFFDKTGTLTQGKMGVTHQFDPEGVAAFIVAIERHVTHPISTAVQTALGSFDPSPDVDDVQQQIGQGIQATAAGSQWKIGNQNWIASSRPIEESWIQRADEIRESGSSPIWISRDNRVVAMLGVADPIRPDANEVLQRLRAMNWRVRVLSGDDPSTVQNVAARLGIDEIDAQGGLLPQDKWQAIEAAMNVADRGGIIMVGDGLNDASALARADVGIALRGGASASLSAAPIMIADGRLQHVVSIVESAGDMRLSIRRNFIVSIAYNAFAVALAMAGVISPLIAAALMPISSLTVIAMTVTSRAGKINVPETAKAVA